MPPVDEQKQEYYSEKWVWDTQSKSSCVLLSPDQTAAYFHTDPVTESLRTAGVRGNRGFSDGEHYWEIRFLEPPIGTSVMVGVGTSQALLETRDYQYVDLLGMDDNSWGLSYKGYIWHGGRCWQYCEPFYDQSTVIGIHLNIYTGTITFYRNGQSLGVAFHNVRGCGQELYPLISSTGCLTEMEVDVRACRYLSLQEKCCLLVAKQTKTKEDIDLLPLPNVVKRHLKDLK